MTTLMSSVAFITSMPSTMVAPALGLIAKELHITSSLQTNLVLSIFVLAYAIGPLIIAPLSEMYGRVRVIQSFNLVFMISNLACGFAKTKEQLMVFRFLSGVGGSAPLAIGGGMLSDMWRPEERGRSISIYSLGTLLGPSLGPIAGGFIAEYTTWRWAFWSVSIADAIVIATGLIFFRETYPPTILGEKARRLRKETGNPDLRSPYEKPDRTISQVFAHAFVRPIILLATQPIVQILAFFMLYLYGLMFLVITTFSDLWRERYHESVSITGLNYISLGIGFIAAAQIGAPLNDRIYDRLKRSRVGLRSAETDTGIPEYRIPLMVPASLLVPVGLFWYGWSAQHHLHWLMPNIGAGLLAMGTTMSFQCIQAYIVDAYTLYAASAIAAATVLRSLAGFAFPLFASSLYDRLGWGWGNSLLGFLALGLGLPTPWALWWWGEGLRKRSRFAAGGEE